MSLNAKIVLMIIILPPLVPQRVLNVVVISKQIQALANVTAALMAPSSIEMVTNVSLVKLESTQLPILVKAVLQESTRVRKLPSVLIVLPVLGLPQ